MEGYRTTRIRRAIVMAADAHKNQKRKEKNIPFISHPLGVGIRISLMRRPRPSEDLICAAILHDTLEDTGLSAYAIKKEFGPEVLRIVQACTEPSKSLSWEERKLRMIHRMRRARLDVKILSCTDKIDNAQSILDSLLDEGLKTATQFKRAKTWDSFNRGYESQKWYFQEITKSIFANVPIRDLPPIFGTLMRLVEQIFGEQVILDKKIRHKVKAYAKQTQNRGL